jgi:cold shock CspA family protein
MVEGGVLVRWFGQEERRYGFVKPDLPIESGGDIFVHLNDVRHTDRPKLRSGIRVMFETRVTPKGRQQATNVHVVEEQRGEKLWLME